MSFNEDLGRTLRSVAAQLLLVSILALVVAAPALAEPWSLDDALGTPDWLTLSGTNQSRYSALGNQYRPGDFDETDEAVMMRTTLQAELKFGAYSIVGELQDSRAYFTPKGTSVNNTVVDAVEPLQAYAAADTSTGSGTLQFKFGRWTQDLGGRRLIARNRFRTSINSFLGPYVTWTGADKSELHAFYSLPAIIRPADRQSVRDNTVKFNKMTFDLRFWGLYYERPDVLFGGKGEFYVFGLTENRDADNRSAYERNLYTPGVRFFKKPKSGQWDFQVESILQFGKRRNSATSPTLDVFAHFHHLEAGYTFKRLWSPRLDIEAEYASGEQSRNDKDYDRFDTLFGPTRRDLGPTEIFAVLNRANLVAVGNRLSFQSTNKRTDGYVHWAATWLAQKNDSFTRGGLRDPAGNSGNFAGYLVEARLRYWLIPKSVRLEVGGASFIEGEFMKDAPNATGNGNPIYGYTNVTFVF